MNQASVTPAPHILVHLLTAPDPSLRETAAHFLVELLQASDPLTRWGTTSYLLHTPMRFYLDALVERLQDKDQPEHIRTWASRLNNARLSSPPATAAQILRIHARLRFLLYLTASLNRYLPQPNA